MTTAEDDGLHRAWGGTHVPPLRVVIKGEAPRHASVLPTTDETDEDRERRALAARLLRALEGAEKPEG
jgi:hypothetical protein